MLTLALTPCRWYAKTIGRGPTAINLVVAHTSVFVDGYLKSSSKYSKSSEHIFVRSQFFLSLGIKSDCSPSRRTTWPAIKADHLLAMLTSKIFKFCMQLTI